MIECSSLLHVVLVLPLSTFSLVLCAFLKKKHSKDNSIYWYCLPTALHASQPQHDENCGMRINSR